MSERPGSTGADPVDEIRRTWLTEDWASVIAGLALIVLVLVGALPASVIP